ncbi:MAG: hypothetical protein H0U86_02050 [Chloroflexi bacterium]|nr:hypothetical protein [Chloroflexota bacterium]
MRRCHDDGSKDLEVLVLRAARRSELGDPARPLGLLHGYPGDARPLAPGAREKEGTYGRTGRPARPPFNPEVRELVLSIARETPRWGCVTSKASSVSSGSGWLRRRSAPCSGSRDVVRPPMRAGPSWTEFLRAHANGIIAGDFFTVETAWLRALYVLLFIELGRRRIHLSASTVLRTRSPCALRPARPGVFTLLLARVT